jgi:hypothetical protein
MRGVAAACDGVRATISSAPLPGEARLASSRSSRRLISMLSSRSCLRARRCAAASESATTSAGAAGCGSATGSGRHAARGGTGAARSTASVAVAMSPAASRSGRSRNRPAAACWISRRRASFSSNSAARWASDGARPLRKCLPGTSGSVPAPCSETTTAPARIASATRRCSK